MQKGGFLHFECNMETNILWAIEKEAAIWRPWDFADYNTYPGTDVHMSYNCCDYNPLRLRNEDVVKLADFEKAHNLG